MPPGVQSARRQADGDEEERAADGTVQRLLDLRYAICPACRQRIRTRLHSVLSRCHTRCPFCRKTYRYAMGLSLLQVVIGGFDLEHVARRLWRRMMAADVPVKGCRRQAVDHGDGGLTVG